MKRFIVTVAVEKSILVTARDAEHAMTRAVAIERNGAPETKVTAIEAVKA